MNQELLEEAIEHWEESGMTVVRIIDSDESTVERILQRGSWYWLYRYFETAPEPATLKVVCSVDLEAVDAERVIQHLAERL